MSTEAQRAAFYARLDTQSVPGCHLWTGGTEGSGYGRLWVAGRSENASRYSMSLLYGPLPEGLLLAHRCGRRACCNPDHLFLTTRKGYQEDLKCRGVLTGAPELNTNAATLTPDEVREIRRDRRSGRVIGLEYGVTKTAVNNIRSGRSWRGLP